MSSLKTANRLKAARVQNLAVFAETLVFIGFEDRQVVKAATAKCWRSLADIVSSHFN